MANPKPKKKAVQNGKARRNLRLSTDLDKWVTAYAEEKNTTVTQIIVDYLTGLRKATEENRVEQI